MGAYFYFRLNFLMSILSSSLYISIGLHLIKQKQYFYCNYYKIWYNGTYKFILWKNLSQQPNIFTFTD